MKTRIAKGNVRKIVWMVGEIQSLIGDANSAYLNDRVTNRAERVLPALQKAFDLCLEITGMYAQVNRPPKSAPTISDGFGLYSPATCPDCGAAMVVVRPGDIRCSAECHITKTYECE